MSRTSTSILVFTRSAGEEAENKVFESAAGHSGNVKIAEKLIAHTCRMARQSQAEADVHIGPDRTEIMTRETMQHCLDAIDKSPVQTVDLTGGAPELNPHFKWFVSEITKRDVEVIVRSNLTILVSNDKFRTYPDFFKEHGVTVIASLPCYTEENTDAQRGDGVFQRSVEALNNLNELGYGKEESGLELHLHKVFSHVRFEGMNE